MPRAEQRLLREKYLKDYVSGSLRLFWQRHAMYFGAFVLAVNYYGKTLAVVCYLLVLLSEAFDHFIAKRIFSWRDQNPRRTDRYFRIVIFGAVVSAFAISGFVLAISWREGSEPHFTPLLFLFAAALFAAMNSHQIILVLGIRLSIFGMAFLAIALQNIVLTHAPLSSTHWLHFFTVMFVMYFIIDCSFAFLRMYRRNLKQMEHLREEHARVVKAYHAKSEFLSMVSHELRTPITSIKGSLNLACSGKLGELPSSMGQMLRIANKNADRLADLIDDLLDFQAIEAGKMEMSLRSTDLRDLVRDSIEATSGYLREKRVQMNFVGTEAPVYALADLKRLMQVLANVISNAIKFSNVDGAVEIGLAASDGMALISVRDFGKGIPPGHESQVFEAFSQIDSTDRRSINGTGLGMAVSKRIMLEHNGDISYESELGAGTVFKISLPLLQVQPAISGAHSQLSEEKKKPKVNSLLIGKVTP